MMMMMMVMTRNRSAKAAAAGILDKSLFLVLVLVLVLSSCWISGARELTKSTHLSGEEDEMGKANLCTLCEEFTAEALVYLSENKTQTQIIEILHNSCSRLLGLKQQCVTLVDYYAPFFFLEIENIQPQPFCQKFNLCTKELLHLHPSENKCEVCHRVMNEALSKLEDPDTQLEIIEVLLKACNAVKGRAKKCKRMVLEYGPLIFANANHFLEKTDICAIMHACPSSSSSSSLLLIKQQAPLLSQKASLVSVL